jgi:8-oxo-dGTP diphosphatase
MAASRVVQAAGGLVWRPAELAGGFAGVEILLVHRPHYDDWSLPKGKLDRSDGSHEAAALREVEEETGLLCRLGSELPSVSYVDRLGQPKTVRYWLMKPTGGELTVNDEVDGFRWLAPEAAVEVLTYPRDRQWLGQWDGRVDG